MTVSEKLFIACIRDTDTETLAKIQTAWIDIKELKQYRYITDYLRDFGEVPPVVEFTGKFKLDESMAPSKPNHYLEELKERFILTVLAENVPGIMTKLAKDPKKGLSQLRTIVGSLEITDHVTKDIRYDQDTKKRYEEYLLKMANKGVTHLSTGSEFLDKYWFGYRKADLVTIGGRAGMGKTWLIVLLCILLEAVLTEEHGDILFISNEMPEDEIAERFDSVRFKLPYAKFLGGLLSRAEQARYKLGLEKLEKQGSRIVFVYNCATLQELESKINLYKPSKVFIDGSYLMESQLKEGWEKIVTITRGLKRIAKNTETPITNTTQLKKGSGKATTNKLDGQDEFAYGSSFMQDSDIGIRMFQNADMVYDGTVGLDHVKGRRLPPDLNLQFMFNLELMNLAIIEGEEDATPVAPPVTF